MSGQNKVTSGATVHSFADAERVSFTNHVNVSLKSDPDLAHLMELDPETDDLFTKCADGLILCKLINDSVPDTIDERVLNLKPKNKFQNTENLNLAINSAKSIGCSVVNIGAEDIMEGRVHLILGVVWQVVRIGLMSKINLTMHPELYRLLEDGEELSDLMKLSPEEILIRWFNYHLKNAGHNRRVANFSGDIKDGENYTILLNQLDSAKCSKDPLKESDLEKRAEKVLENADKLECRKFVTAKDIVAGNPKLNLGFVANLFNTCPGLEPLTEEEKSALDEALFNSQGSREARAFALWMNSLGIDPFVNNLFEDLRDGLVLLRAFDKISPGIVDWKSVNEPKEGKPLNKFKMVENTNYCVVLGKQLKFSLVGICGGDLTDGNETLTLALVWQMMRFHVLSILSQLGGGQRIDDRKLIQMANDRVSGASKDSKMDSFQDQSLKNSKFFIDLLDTVRPGTIDYSIVTDTDTEEDNMMNAKYALSVARKLGAVIFLLPEDIVELKSPKLIMTMVAAILAVAMEN